jgi:hypothetical protein
MFKSKTRYLNGNIPWLALSEAGMGEHGRGIFSAFISVYLAAGIIFGKVAGSRSGSGSCPAPAPPPALPSPPGWIVPCL